MHQNFVGAASSKTAGGAGDGERGVAGDEVAGTVARVIGDAGDSQRGRGGRVARVDDQGLVSSRNDDVACSIDHRRFDGVVAIEQGVGGVGQHPIVARGGEVLLSCDHTIGTDDLHAHGVTVATACGSEPRDRSLDDQGVVGGDEVGVAVARVKRGAG